MTDVDRLRLDYRAGLLRYVSRRDEAPLHVGYQIGRSALVRGLSILDLVQVHHDVLLPLLESPDVDENHAVASAAAEFLVEVLASYDMARPDRPARS